MPVCSVPAFLHGERAWNIDGQTVAYLDAMRYTQWFNLLGAPAAVVPRRPLARKPPLPIGVQIAGRPYQDEIVLGDRRGIGPRLRLSAAAFGNLMTTPFAFAPKSL